MRQLVFVGHAFFRHDGAVAARQAVHHSRAHAARCRAARDDTGVHAMEVEDGTQVGLEERRCHALVDDDVAPVVYQQAVVELRAAAADLDVLQRIGRIGTRAPHTAVLARVHIGHIGPHHRKVARAKLRRKFVHVVELFRVGLVGGGKFAHAGVGLLQVDIDQHRLAPEAEALARRLRLDLAVQLACGLVRLFHVTGPSNVR